MGTGGNTGGKVEAVVGCQAHISTFSNEPIHIVSRFLVSYVVLAHTQSMSPGIK